MADIDLVIKIPEEEYKKFLRMKPEYFEDTFCYIKAIQDGTPLPKGHGPLLDGSELLEHAWRDRLDTRERIAEMIKNMPPIIPADKETEARRSERKSCENCGWLTGDICPFLTTCADYSKWASRQKEAESEESE